MKRSHFSVRHCILACLAWAAIGVAHAGDIERQRELFAEVFADVELGRWEPIEQLAAADRQLLQDYVLWPDLRATWLRANINTVTGTQVNAFLQQHGALRPVRELRYRYALSLVGKNDLAGYLKIYQQFYHGQDIAKLDCLALQAEIDAGRYSRVPHRALDLWLIGASQTVECDPVFDFLRAQKLLGATEYRHRYALAIEARNFSLARWLAKKIDSQHLSLATTWQQAQTNPEDFLRRNRTEPSDSDLRDQLAYAVQRLTFRDPEIAESLWARISSKHPFTAAQTSKTAQHIALWTARDNLPRAYKLLSRLPAAARDDEVHRWRARVSLREGRWKRLIGDIAEMGEEERKAEQWQYWNAIALIESGQAADAHAQLTALSTERSYYGFLAADKLGKQYALDHADLVADGSALRRLEVRDDVVRARELFLVGQDSRGRSEWDALIRHLSDEEKAQAAILAHRWGWHSRAIAAVASLGEYDDLSIRYPLPYQDSFQAFASQASIPPTWAYGIARSESLFMRDVKSSAGAIGLMQIMPATGRDVARQIRMPYQGLVTLVDPQSNIRLGTQYLGKMADRYDGNNVPATAAYNAGPGRVDQWLPKSGSIDARIWIENIPFNETRKYVKRVFAAQAIFHWRLSGGKMQRLTNELLIVRARSETRKVARR